MSDELWPDLESEPQSFVWQSIATIPKRIKWGQSFLGRWKNALGDWEVVICYYGQFGGCFITLPLGYYASAEGPEGKGPQAPRVTPEEWCDIPGGHPPWHMKHPNKP